MSDRTEYRTYHGSWEQFEAWLNEQAQEEFFLQSFHPYVRRPTMPGTSEVYAVAQRITWEDAQ